MKYDYAVHSDFLIHWTGKPDIDNMLDKDWYESDKSNTKGMDELNELYINRLKDILDYGLWMTEEPEIPFGDKNVVIPSVNRDCFTELKLSESRKHANAYGRLGIGVKRPFVIGEYGRPLVYYGFDKNNDIFLNSCLSELKNKDLLQFFKPMNSSRILNYDFYSEFEWRIIYTKELLANNLIIDPRDEENIEEYKYFCSLSPEKQDILKYLILLNGWFAMIIYPSLAVKNMAQNDDRYGIRDSIQRIKNLDDRGNNVEGRNWPIEVDLDACRNF